MGDFRFSMYEDPEATEKYVVRCADPYNHDLVIGYTDDMKEAERQRDTTNQLSALCGFMEYGNVYEIVEVSHD